MKYAKGDIVRYMGGKVDWEIIGTFEPDHYVLKSGMSERLATASEDEIRPWVPHER